MSRPRAFSGAAGMPAKRPSVGMFSPTFNQGDASPDGFLSLSAHFQDILKKLGVDDEDRLALGEFFFSKKISLVSFSNYFNLFNGFALSSSLSVSWVG